MIVELFGLPGSGKSTWARTQEQGGIWVRVRIDSRIELLAYALCFVLRHPVSTFWQIVYLVRYAGSPRLWYTKFMNLFVVHNAKYMKASRMRYALLDQGHLQNLLSLFDTPLPDHVLDGYLSHLPLPDIVVCFDVAHKVREQRLAQRGHRPRQHLPPDLLQSWELASEAHFGTVFRKIPTLLTTKVLTEKTSESESQRIIDVPFLRFVMHARMPTEKAHGLQIARTLEALTRVGTAVELWVPKRHNPITRDLFSYYDMSVTFPVRTTHSWDILQYGHSIGPIAFWIDTCGLLCALLFLRTDSEIPVLTRSAPVAWLLGLKGVPVYFEAHMWPQSKSWAFLALLRGVRGVLANSEGTRERFLRAGVREVSMVRNGVDLKRFQLVRAQEDMRRQLDLPIHAQIVMYVGSFARWKGVATLCRAWCTIRTQYPDTMLVLVGGTVGELQFFSECAGISEDKRVRVIAHVSPEHVPQYLHASDILVLPNEPVSEEAIHYTSPIKMFEYMASGRPIVASDLPSIREVLSPEIAILVRAGDPDALAQGIITVLEHSEVGEALALEASRKVSQFDWTSRARSILAYCLPSRP
jgi:glycosyltransferase involved in cell wall biosynthesis